MDFRVKLSKAPFSARKARLVLDLVRGKNVDKALEILAFCHKRPARALEKLIRSCLANVDYFNEQDSRKGEDAVDVDSLLITEVRADEGPLVGYARRFRPRARGMAFPLNLRTCHIKLALSGPGAEEEEEPEEEGEMEVEPHEKPEEKKIEKTEAEAAEGKETDTEGNETEPEGTGGEKD